MPYPTSDWSRTLPRKHEVPNRIHGVAMPPLLVRLSGESATCLDYVDRNNIAAARLAGLEQDLKPNASGTHVSVG
ncbi:hypothetical protein MY10362_006651 [Beauveria mimosiformis]